eukprot:scaffold6115_cov57-Phaeocystis_antarctica.AAC.6
MEAEEVTRVVERKRARETEHEPRRRGASPTALAILNSGAHNSRASESSEAPLRTDETMDETRALAHAPEGRRSAARRSVSSSAFRRPLGAAPPPATPGRARASAPPGAPGHGSQSPAPLCTAPGKHLPNPNLGGALSRRTPPM